MTDSLPSDASSAKPRKEKRPLLRQNPAFLIAFGVSALPALVGVAVLWSNSSAADPALMAMLYSPALWLVGIVVGVGLYIAKREDQGRGVVLGTLAGAIVGFSICSGGLLLGGTLGI